MVLADTCSLGRRVVVLVTELVAKLLAGDLSHWLLVELTLLLFSAMTVERRSLLREGLAILLLIWWEVRCTGSRFFFD